VPTRVPTQRIVSDLMAGYWPPAPKPLQGRRILAVCGCLSLLGGLSVDMYLPALPQVSRSLHARASIVELTLTACLIGFAIGQLILGPVTDRWGRRRPLVAGIAGFVVVSLACTLAPSVYALCAFRLLQGLCGAAGVVMPRTIIRDLYDGDDVARIFSTLLLITAAAPLLGPQVGAELLRITSWRGIFVAQMVMGAILLVVAVSFVGESLPVERRHSGGLREAGRHAAAIWRDPQFVGHFLAGVLAFGAIYSYIGGSSFVLQNVYGLSPQRYGLVYGVNALGVVIGSQVNARLISRFGPARLLTFGLAAMSLIGLGLLLILTTRWGGLAAVLPLMFGLLTSLGFVSPNAMALAVRNHGDSAGTAIAIQGSAQFAIGGLVAPLVGIGGRADATPMAVSIAAMSLGAVATRWLLARRRPVDVRPDTPPAPAIVLEAAEEMIGGI